MTKPKKPTSAKPIRSCEICGCTDNNACRTAYGPCWWVQQNLCSACAI